ncbi:LOW QUALITY PROTEIN: uncharacterized protein LOC135200089 [Macrobrachium nipponense]|uniref:LOW QUALITY PROTEIN: uncharacterized protein LOC135200089 n=1 Tax=Macrobrachium nipponense TaxID=159736 RepID=UPI0030C7E3A0
MDDVFGNSSSETVMEADLSKVLANINQNIADLQYLELQLPPEAMESAQAPQTGCLSAAAQPQAKVNFQEVAAGNVSVPVHHHTQEPVRQISFIRSSVVTHKNGPTTNLAHIVNQPSGKTSGLPLPAQGMLAPKDAEGQFAVPSVVPRSTVAHVPVITSVGHNQGEGPQPQPRYLLETVGKGGNLRHTQSAVVEKRFYDQSVRPRAQSTGATTTQANYQHVQYRVEYHNLNFHTDHHSHGQSEHRYELKSKLPSDTAERATTVNTPKSQYDNMPGPGAQALPASVKHLPSQHAPPALAPDSALPTISEVGFHPMQMPQYVNIPTRNYAPASPLQKLAVALETGGSNSAPSTPRGGGGAAVTAVPPPRFHHSYIELWTGAKEERDSLSDSECEELKRSFQEPQTPVGPSPGYVEMSSPYVKSPQVASPFNGSVLADLATKLASYAGHQPRNIFCPFCPRYFGYEKSLGSHIHKQHKEELNSMVDSKPGEVKIQFCPICQARFFNVSVLPKHLIDFHRASVVEILEKKNCIMSDTSGIQCPFCIKKVPHGKTGEQVLLYHMQQLHFNDFEKMVQSKFQPYSGNSNRESLKSISSTDVSEVIAFQPGITSTPGLSNKLNSMSILSADSKRNMEALNLDATWSSHQGILKSPMTLQPQPAKINPNNAKEETDKEVKKQLPTSVSKGILRNKSEFIRKPSVKRELRFSVPPVTSEEVFVPESPEHCTPERSVEHQQQNNLNQIQQMENQRKEATATGVQRTIPIRIDSLSAADFMDLNDKAGGERKRRRLGLGIRSRKAFKKKDKENISERDLSNRKSGASKLVDNAKKLITEGSHTGKEVVPTKHTRTFRRPKPVPVPRVPELPPPMETNGCHTVEEMMQIACNQRSVDSEASNISPFTHLKLYSPLRMFRCSSCHVKFCDNESLSGHIGSRHRGLLHILRPQYSCGVCSARFYENKYLVKHCLQHHTSLLEIRSPTKHKISIYRFTQT